MSHPMHGHDVHGITVPEMKEAEAETLRRYGDILDAERPEGKNRPKASPKQRAAQFLPFAALTGYEEEIRREGSDTEERAELSEAEKEEINAALIELEARIGEEPAVRLKVFEKAPDKCGGIYRTRMERVKRIDPLRKELILADLSRIDFADLFRMEICEDPEEDASEAAERGNSGPGNEKNL